MSFLTHEQNGLVWLTSSLLDGVCHGFSTRQGGVSQPPFDTLNLAPGRDDDPAAVRENYRRFYECEAKYEKLLAEYQDGESDKITDAEAKKYMDETYSRIQTLVLPTTDADSAALPDEKLEELNALAAQLADDLNAGGSMDELGPETLEKAFEICGREYAEDTASSYMSKSFLTAESTSYSEEFVQGVVAAEVGAAGVYDGYSVPMIYQKIANYEDNDDFTANYKTTILSEITSAAFSDKVEEETAAYAVTEDASAVKTYSPSKIRESV